MAKLADNEIKKRLIRLRNLEHLYKNARKADAPPDLRCRCNISAVPIPSQSCIIGAKTKKYVSFAAFPAVAETRVHSTAGAKQWVFQTITALTGTFSENTSSVGRTSIGNSKLVSKKHRR